MKVVNVKLRVVSKVEITRRKMMDTNVERDFDEIVHGEAGERVMIIGQE